MKKNTMIWNGYAFGIFFLLLGTGVPISSTSLQNNIINSESTLCNDQTIILSFQFDTPTSGSRQW